MDILNILKYRVLLLTDIDECTSDNGGCSEFADCNNTMGNFTCTCWDGFTGNGFTCPGKLNSITTVTL